MGLAAAIREEAAMNSSVKKHSIVISSRKTSISLEDAFWACVRQIARERATTLSELIGMIDAGRNGSNLSSAIRVFVLDHYSNNVASAVRELSDQSAGLSEP
jgi:predicted DNA-binding ribbon-helix-helix protein